MKRVLDDGRLINFIEQGFEDMRPRQALPPVYLRSGDLYIVRRDVLMEQNLLVGRDSRAYIIEPERAVNIDTRFDLWLADYLIGERMSEGNP
jgi:CMP-N,N'-diacetyllegionaminic acid synthase